jgi:hypothetical protein
VASRRRRWASLALALGLAVASAACGGGDSGGNKAEFLAKGNELCRTLAGKYEEGLAKLGSNPSKEAMAEFLRSSFIGEAMSTYRAVGGVTFPKADREMLDTLLRQTLAELAVIQEDPVVGGNPANQRRLVKEFKDYGLDQCGAGFAGPADKAAFVSEANSICRALNESYHKAYKDADLTLASPPEQLKVLLHTRIVPLTRQALTDIEGIGYEDPTLASIVADTRTLLDKIDADPNRVTYGDTPEELAINKRWIDFGPGDCGGQLVKPS